MEMELDKVLMLCNLRRALSGDGVSLLWGYPAARTSGTTATGAPSMSSSSAEATPSSAPRSSSASRPSAGTSPALDPAETRERRMQPVGN